MEKLAPEEGPMTLLSHNEGGPAIGDIPPLRPFTVRHHIPAVSAVDAIPTDEQIRQEHHRLHKIDFAVFLGALITDEDYSRAVVRHNKVVSARSGMWTDGQAILQQLEQMNARMQAMEDRVNAQLQRLHSRLDALEARVNTNGH